MADLALHRFTVAEIVQALDVKEAQVYAVLTELRKLLRPGS